MEYRPIRPAVAEDVGSTHLLRGVVFAAPAAGLIWVGLLALAQSLFPA